MPLHIHRDNWIVVVFYVLAAIGSVHVVVFAYGIVTMIIHFAAHILVGALP